MQETNHRGAFILGLFIFLGLAFLGYFIGTSAIKFKEYERSVTVKGLSQKELPADIVLWPIQFERADNNLETLYLTLEKDKQEIFQFLTSNIVAGHQVLTQGIDSDFNFLDFLIHLK